MTLTAAEKQSALWIKIRDHMNERLDTHRRKNDGDLEPIPTARLRGRIAEIQVLLAMEKDPDPAQVADHGDE